MAEDPQDDPLVGQTLLDKLRVIRVLGGGGMGSVYEVEHLFTGHRRALKLIKPEYVKRRTFMKRLVREAGVAGKLKTPYVVETYDAGTMEDGSAYVLMELLDGQELIDLLQTEEILPLPRLVGIMVQVCEGVAVAHGAGIIHRDLKPENVFLIQSPSGQERVKILDFGISKFKDAKDQTSRLTAEGTILGTPFYMSPEQAAGREVDERTDVYSVGVMMYEALSGRLPFDAKSVGALFIKIAAGECLPLSHFRPDLPPELGAIVEKAMHRDREQRYASMEALRAELVPYAPSELRVRAKTISDSPKPSRGTADYRELPRPGRVPGETGEPAGGTLSMGAPQSRREAPARSEETLLSEPPVLTGGPAPSPPGGPPPPAERPAPSRAARRLPWLLAAAALVALGALVVLSRGGDEEPVVTPIAQEPPALPAQGPAVEPPPPVEPPEEAPPMDAPPGAEPEEAPGPGEPSPTKRVIRRPLADPPPHPRTPAEKAGLDPNPYGGR